MMPHVQAQISVLIRFSYVAETGVRAALGGTDAARALLYDPARLERRFALFEALALASLLRQTDRDFTAIFLVGADFPVQYRQRLERLVAPLADPRIVALPPLPMFRATRRSFTQTLRPGHTHLTTARLDDDDALSLDTIARLRAMTGPALALSRADPVAIAFNNGLFLEVGASQNRVYQVVERAPLGIAAALVAPIGHSDTIFSRNHRHLGQFYNLYTDATIPSFIRSVHADNDSEPYASGRVIGLTDTEAQAILRAGFAQTLEGLHAIRP